MNRSCLPHPSSLWLRRDAIHRRPHRSAAQRRPAPTAGAPTTVSTASIESRKLQTTVMLPAQLIPYEQVDIYPKSPALFRPSRWTAGHMSTEDSCWFGLQPLKS